ncbi:MAG: hypothetical protein ACK4E2_04085 [Pseudothermotoga sp.]
MKITISDYGSFQGDFAIDPDGTLFVSGRTIWILDPGLKIHRITYSPVKAMQTPLCHKIGFSMW